MAKQQYDWKRLSDGDLDLSSGDIEYVESTPQHQKDILLSSPGDWRLSPLMGVDLGDFVDGEDTGELLQTINRLFTADGMDVQQLSLTGPIVAPYK